MNVGGTALVWSWHASPIRAAIVTASAMLLAAIGLLVLPAPRPLAHDAAVRGRRSVASVAFRCRHARHGQRRRRTFGARGRPTSRATSALVSWLWLTLSVDARPRGSPASTSATPARTCFRCSAASCSRSPARLYVVEAVQGPRPRNRSSCSARSASSPDLPRRRDGRRAHEPRACCARRPWTARKRLRPLFPRDPHGDPVGAARGPPPTCCNGGLRVSWLVSGAAHVRRRLRGRVRALRSRRLSDMSIPVARPVILLLVGVAHTLAGAFMAEHARAEPVLPLASPRSGSWRGARVPRFRGRRRACAHGGVRPRAAASGASWTGTS